MALSAAPQLLCFELTFDVMAPKKDVKGGGKSAQNLGKTKSANQLGKTKSGTATAAKEPPKVQIPSVMMHNNLTMPVLGFGTWLGLDDKFNFLTEDIPKLMEALSYAIDLGYRYIDTAHLYRVEPEIGVLLETKMKDKVCTRQELFVSTKVWQHNHRAKDVLGSVQASLKRLNLDYVDQLLMHWPMAISPEGQDEDIDYLETWKGFQEALQKGLAKSIGVCNFNHDQMRRLCANCKIKPAALQIEINLNLAQNELVDYCKRHNVVPVGYAPFGTMVPARHVPHSPPPKLDDPIMKKIADKHGKTITQVTLRYLFQRGVVIIPKTVTKERVLENASIFEFELDHAECQEIAKFDVGYRSVRPLFYQDYTYYPFEKIDCEKMTIPESFRKWKNGAKQDVD